MASRNSDPNHDPSGKSPGKRKPVGAVDDAEFRGYINLDLTAEQKEQYPAWSESASYWEALQGFTEIGVNISLKRERKSGGFLASGTQRDPDSENAGLCVTARAKDAPTALGRLLFILTLLSHSPSWEAVKPMSDPDRW